jgi:hypothetical protein
MTIYQLTVERAFHLTELELEHMGRYNLRQLAIQLGLFDIQDSKLAFMMLPTGDQAVYLRSVMNNRVTPSPMPLDLRIKRAVNALVDDLLELRNQQVETIVKEVAAKVGARQ